MKRTNKNVKETAKPAQQSAFKTPAQELAEFKTKVLAMRYGEFIWRDLNAYPFEEWGRKLSATGYELYVGTFGLMVWGKVSPTVNKEFMTALREIQHKADERWPEFARLLRRVPDELKAYQERYNRNRRSPNHVVLRDARDLRQEPGRPRDQKLAERDAQIVYMKDVQGYSFGKIARKLKVGRSVAMSAYYRIKRNPPTR